MGKRVTKRGVRGECALLVQSQSREGSCADERRRRLERYATWTAADQAQFVESLRAQRVLDEEACSSFDPA